MSYTLSILPIFFSSAAIGFFLALLTLLVFRPNGWKESLPLVAVLSLMGAYTGLAGGLSRESVVGEIIPVFLGLIGAVAVYLFGTSKSRSSIVSLGLIALTIALLISHSLGASERARMRQNSQEPRDLRTHCVRAYTDAELLKNRDAFEVFEDKLGKKCSEALKWHFPSKKAKNQNASPNAP
ncbi:MAG: hypothetical protein OXO52_22335 [Rhodospirillales bacterium]|nr:hypothetical protein [Rhodospirillales bacterium]MDE0381289.1 hypothetical protein [Rhodospirillales bacterium]